MRPQNKKAKPIKVWPYPQPCSDRASPSLANRNVRVLHVLASPEEENLRDRLFFYRIIREPVKPAQVRGRRQTRLITVVGTACHRLARPVTSQPWPAQHVTAWHGSTTSDALRRDSWHGGGRVDHVERNRAGPPGLGLRHIPVAGRLAVRQGIVQLLHAGEAPLGVLLQTAQDHLFEVSRYRGPQLARRQRHLVQVSREQLEDRVARNGACPVTRKYASAPRL
jgi:hypothetical protein